MQAYTKSNSTDHESTLCNYRKTSHAKITVDFRLKQFDGEDKTLFISNVIDRHCYHYSRPTVLTSGF